LGKAPDKIQLLAMYGSKAFTSSAGNTFSSNYVGNSAAEDQRIALWKARGNNLVYLNNTNNVSNPGPSGFGYDGVTYTNAAKAKLKAFIKKCYNQGITIGVVGGIANGTGPAYGDAAYNPGPAQRVVNYNAGVAFDEKIQNFLIEEEYWREIGGNMTFSQFKTACQNVYNILHPAGVSNDIYFVRNAPGEAAQLAPYIDIWWMTTYLDVASGDNQVRYDKIRPWIQELAATLPATPIKVGALISLESYSYNKTGGNHAGSNFVGYQAEGRRIGAPFVNPQPIVTSAKNFNQLADKITHNGTVGLPPIDFNSEPASVTNYINWMGIQVFDDDLNPNLPLILDANTNQVFAFGDGSPQDAVEFGVAQQVAGLVPQNAARFLYLGDVYNTGTQAEFIQNTFSFDKLYGTQSTHNLLILTSATPGQREWANRSVGYDPYWNGSLAGVGSVQPNWDGDRTITNPHYYSFYLPADDGTLWKFISINSMEDGFPNGGVTVGSTMYNWLVNELNDSSVGRRKIVFCHHPRFSSDGTYGDNANMQPVWDAMQNKAMILLSGRVHNYQRMNMRDSGGNVVVGGGVYQVISGTGGTATFGFAASYLAGAIGYRATNNGATRLTLYNDHVDVCFVRNDGVVLDCASLPVATTIPPVVDAGPDQVIVLPALATMAGSATDTNTPSLTLVNVWTKTSGPGTVIFTNPNSLTTTVSFSVAGTYVLRLTSNNGVNSSFDEMTVTVSGSSATRTLSIQSSPATGASITVNTADVNGNTNGTTNFTRIYYTATTPTLTCPATFGGLTFQRWQRDGIDYAFTLAITVTDTVDHTFTAVYGTPSTVANYRLQIDSNIGQTYFIINTVDIYGGFSPVTDAYLTETAGYYYDGTPVTLTASVTPSLFLYWLKDGLAFSGNTNLTVTIPITADTRMTMVLDESALNTFEIDNGSTDPVCPGGTGTGFATPLSPGTYTFLWSTGAVVDNIVAVAGTYTVLITETTALYPVNTMTARVVIRDVPEAIAVDFNVVYSDCGGTTATVQALPSGGTAPYTYLWDTAETTQSISVTIGVAHSVVVTDANGCVSASFPYTAPSVVTMVLTPSHTDVTCNEGANGTATVVPSLGVAPYYYAWTKSGSPGNVYPNTQTITGLTAGTYDVVVTDSRGCTDTESIVVAQPAAITSSVTVTNVTCNGADDGTVTFSPSGGTGPYTYVVDGTTLPSNTAINLDIGPHSYLVIDSNGCTVSGSFTITEPTAVTSSLAITDVVCYGGSSGQLVVTAGGGTAPYEYSYDGAGYVSSNTKTGLSAGGHAVVVKDANGCLKSTDYTVGQPADIVVTKTVTNPSYTGASDGSIALAIVGGTYPIVVTWADGTIYNLASAGSILYDGLVAGTYTATVVDTNGCTKNVSQALVDPPDVPPVDPPNDVDVDRFSILANCCLGDKIYEVFKGYANGHVALDCIAYPAMLLSKKVNLLRKWYTLGQTLGGAKGMFVWAIVGVTGFNNKRFVISTPGLPTVSFDGDFLLTYSQNMTLLLAALTTAGYDVEYESDSGYIFIYSPMNSFYNGIPVTITVTLIIGGTSSKATIYSRNGFMGAVTPCVTSDKFTPNCLSVDDKNLLIEQIRVACDSCLCGDYRIKDTI